MNVVQRLAKLFVHRATELELKGKKRDDAAIEFFMGAYAGCHTLSMGNKDSAAGMAADHILRVTSMVICVRGYAAVKEIADSVKLETTNQG